MTSIWTIISQMITAITVCSTLLFTIRKYMQERNRGIYEKRLNEVYAPLYSYLIKQETIRKVLIPNIKLENAPIITWTSNEVTVRHDLTGNIIERTENKKNILDRKYFVEILNNINKGLADPKLLVLLNSYEVLIYLEENLQQESKDWKTATNKKVEVELKLFDTVVKGYEENIRKLELDDKYEVINLYKFEP